ncbi:MAG: hypothetical protein M3295_03640 [Chloroflexota bacterium]|nr:hypothetical protein [Chloroflexota bacterium]
MNDRRSAQLALLRILLVVSAIVVVPMLGGAIAGLVADGIARTSPMFALIGFGIGNLIAIVGVWLFIRSGLRRRGDPDAR